MKFWGSAVAVWIVSAALPTPTQGFAGISPSKNTVRGISRASSSSPSSSSSLSLTFLPRKNVVPSSTQYSHHRRRRHHRSPTAIGMTDSSSSEKTTFTIGIVGATGAVGKEIRQCLETRQFPVDRLRIFGSARSAGSTIETDSYGPIEVELFDVDRARECDVVFLAVSGDFALEHAEALSSGLDGTVVIDNSSAFRYKPGIPLVVPEINGQCTKGSKLIANPNCTTAIAVMALWPLHKLFGLKRVLVSTYQAASGAGQPGMDELKDGTKAWLESDGETSPENKIFAYPLPFNVIPQIDKFQDNGYTKEEMKVTWECRKICGLAEDFPISCSAVRIPTIRAHSEVIVVETEKPVDVQEARKALDEAPGVKLVDDPSALGYPMPLTATGQYDVEVGRVRQNLVFGDHGLEFFVCGDQLLRGAALNAVLVAEEMVSNGALEEFAKEKAEGAAPVEA